MPTATPEAEPEAPPPKRSSAPAAVADHSLFEDLRADHAQMVALLEAALAAPGPCPGRTASWQAFTLTLTAHCHAEEDALYRLMSRMPVSLDMAEVSIEEHDHLQETVSRADALQRVGGAEFSATAGSLRDTLTAHLRDETDRVMPIVAGMFDADELRRLSERYRCLRERHARAILQERSRAEAYDTWPPDALYELAQRRRIRGRGRMGRTELITALRRFG